MSENTNVVGNSFLDARSKAGRFDLTSIALHWLTIVLVGAQFATAWLLSRPGANVEALLTAHRSTGMFVWAVVIARIAWRSYFAELPPFPASSQFVTNGRQSSRVWTLCPCGELHRLSVLPISG